MQVHSMETGSSTSSYYEEEFMSEEIRSKLRLGENTIQQSKPHDESLELEERDYAQRRQSEHDDVDVEEHEDDDDDDENDYEEEEEEEDFSFSSFGGDALLSPVAAEDAFQDGQIRRTFPLFDQNLLLDDYENETMSVRRDQLPRRPPVRKVFVEAPHLQHHHDNHPHPPPLPPPSTAAEAHDVDSEAAGPYCAWNKNAIEASPETCKKSNSTGFSKLWRFRDLLNRSNSDGRDAYVFLHNSPTTTATTTTTTVMKREQKTEKIESSSSSSAASSRAAEKKVNGESKVQSSGGGVGGGKVAKPAAANTKKGGAKAQKSPMSLAHEMHYKRNRASREEDRHRSYLPYRPELVGFFTNVNGGMSRNVHPF